MKKINILAATACFALALTSCDSQLDVTSYTEPNTSNFPAAKSDVTKELNGAYSTLNAYCNDPLQSPYFVWDLMSDEQNGGGGTGDVECHAVSHLMSSKEDLFDKAFTVTYQGITRTSTIIYSIDNFNWAGDEENRNQLLGEAYFLRGLYYLWGSQLFGDIPAYWAVSRPTPCPQQSAENVIYPHILADLVSASKLMTKKTQGDGHATKYAAEALLARAYMFYQGFYKKAGELATANLADIELPEQEGVSGPLTKQQVIDGLKDVVSNGGFKLLGDYRNLWQYTNELTVGDYAYTKDVNGIDGKPLAWAGNGNDEQLFQIQFMNAASWNGTTAMGYTNMTSLYQGLRCDADNNKVENGGENTFPFGQGWGQGTVTQNSWSEWPDQDIRKKASILNCEQELKQFAYTTSCSEETGLYNKKMLPVTCSKTNWGNHNAAYTWWACLEDGYTNNNGNSFQGDHFADIILIRYADVLLMLTEMTGDASYMNEVRHRAGLGDATYTWENIKKERHYELAFEGLRFNDLRRWSGIDGGESCEAAQAIEKAKEGQKVNYTGRWTTMKHASSSWAKRYAQTNGFLPIPPAEIRKVNDESILKQNAGWGTSDANMSGTPVY